MARWLTPAFAACLHLALACSARLDASEASGGSKGPGVAGSSGTHQGPELILNTDELAPSAPVATGLESVCDGIDEDLNGVTDDVDVGKDGVCDCLRIATVGESSPWAQTTTFLDWIMQRGSSKAGNIPSTTPLTAALLREYQVLVVLYPNHAPIVRTPAEAEALATWVAEGGGLITTTGYTGSSDDIVNTNTLLAPFGVAYNLGEDILHGSEGAYNGLYDVIEWAPHPVAAGIRIMGANNGCSLLDLAGGPPAKRTVVATQTSSKVVAYALEHGKGRVFTWADEWIIFDSFWKQQPNEPETAPSRRYDAPRFWLNMINWVMPKNLCQVPVPTVVH